MRTVRVLCLFLCLLIAAALVGPAPSQAEPGLLLIGVGPASDCLLVTASREQRWLGMAGLLEMIGGGSSTQ